MAQVREIPCREITEAVRRLFMEANTELPADLLKTVRDARERETSSVACSILDRILENADVACREKLPLCQDTGLAIVFAEIGQDVHVVDGDFPSAVREGVRQAYRDGYLRKSVCDPLSRVNTGDNTPAILHTEIVPGHRIRIIAMPKGGGSENMSGVSMLLPAAGWEGIRQHVLQKVAEGAANACAPVLVGVGIGGAMETAIVLARRALLRTIGEPNGSDERLRDLERGLLADINALGIGPQGLGGRTTALAVHVEMAPCHIASLPVAFQLQCHAVRHREAIL
ncbi:MAG TPA: fumarate hydratase [Syntrophales bacterium]|nr:fumarate hydratase [Syntrophales bacterium]